MGHTGLQSIIQDRLRPEEQRYTTAVDLENCLNSLSELRALSQVPGGGGWGEGRPPGGAEGPPNPLWSALTSWNIR